MPPVDVTEIHAANIAGTEPEARQEQNCGAVSQSNGSGAITGSNNAVDIGGRQIPRQRG